MTKLDLQQELLEKVKPGTKPSDIKRQVKPSPKPVNQDEGYESDESVKSNVPKAPLPNQAKNLQAEISSLKKRLATYQDFKEADLKIKEKYKQEIAEHKKTIADLQNQVKPTTKETQTQATQTERAFEIKNYSCQICFQERKIPSQLLRVKGLGGERNKKI